jgi:hypothetical protein
VAEGGRLGDLLEMSWRLGRETPFRRIGRLLGVVEKLVAKGGLGPAVVSSSLKGVEECLGVLEGGA